MLSSPAVRIMTQTPLWQGIGAIGIFALTAHVIPSPPVLSGTASAL